MKIVQIVPGTGTYYCGACIREHALARQYMRLGHQVSVVPMYLPTMQTEPDLDENPMFFGGINVYLQQKFPIFRKTPRWLDRLLDGRALLRFSSRFAGMTSPQDLGDLTISVLRGEEGNQRKELQRLVEWLKESVKPDVVCLSTVLLAGLAKEIKTELGIPVVSTLQGEDEFLDYLPKSHRERAWKVLSERVSDLDALISVSDYFRDLMVERLGTGSKVQALTVYNGIDYEPYPLAAPDPESPTIGYLARLSPDKGLHILIEAFSILKKQERWKALRLKIGGSALKEHRGYIRQQKSLLRDRFSEDEVVLFPDLPDEAKPEFFKDLSVFSVPAVYGEAFGLYVLEALASGVPVVQPDHAAFPEIIRLTGGGLLFQPEDPTDLAEKIETLLSNPELARQFGLKGREAAADLFSVKRMAEQMLNCLYQVTR